MAGQTVIVTVAADTAKFTAGMKGVGSQLDGVMSGFGKLAGAAAGVMAAMGLANLTSEAAAATDATDKFKKSLDFAGLDTATIDRLTASTKQYADQTVYSLGDIQNITAQLASNGVKGYDQLAQAAGNLNAVAGGNAETFKSVGMVLTQTAGAGKLTTENWNQLAEAIPGASGILQDALKKNGAFTGNFRDAMAKGQITAEEFNTALLQIGMSDKAKEAATATDTFEGAFGNLQATVTGGLADILKELKPFITEFVNGFSAQVKPALEGVKNFLTNDLIPSIKGFGEWIDQNKDVIGALGVALAVLLGPLLGVKIAIAAIGAALEIWSAITKIATAVQAAFNFVMNLNPIGLIVLAIAALVAGLVYFFTQTETGKKIWADFTAFLTSSWQGFTEFIQVAWDQIVFAFNYAVGQVNKFMIDARNGITDAWNAVLKFFQEIPGKVGAVFSAAGNWLVESGRKIMDGLKSGVTNAWNAVVTFFREIPGKITGALGNLGSLLFNAGKAVLQGFLDGLKNIWNNITGFVGDIAGWIQSHKGPISKDRTLLIPAGQAIMGGFLGALKDGYADVQDFVSSVAPGVSDALAGPAMASAAVGGNGTFYSFDGLTFQAATDSEASVLEEFVAMARRKARAA